MARDSDFIPDLLNMFWMVLDREETFLIYISET